MTSRELIEAAFRHQEPDRTPWFEYVMRDSMAERFLGRPYLGDHDFGPPWQAFQKEYGFEAAVRQSAIDLLDLACRLGFDMIYMVPNPRPPGGAPAGPPPGPMPEDPVERIRQRNQRTRERLTAGALPKEIHYIYAFLKEEMKRRGIDLPIIAPACAHGIWTDTDLLETMFLEPEVAHEHFRLCTEWVLPRVESFISLGVDMIEVGGDFAGNRPLISPQMYHDFIMPEVRRVARRVHQAGRWSINASDGNLWSVIEDFLIGCEVDGYLEADYHAGMDLRRLKAEYGDRITFLGNLDCGNILSFGSAEDVRRHTLECLEAGLGHGGHILSASNAITASVPLENYLAMIGAYRDMFSLPPLTMPYG
jgi:hypothetical protein